MRTAGLVLPLLLVLQGCAYHRLVVSQPNPPDQRYHPVNSTALAWGAVEQQSVASQCPTNLLSEVRVRTSFVDALGTVLSLGLWQPARMEYRCSKLPTQSGTIEP
jgi:Bor protein